MADVPLQTATLATRDRGPVTKTLFDEAMRFVGEVMELPGQSHDPFIQWCFMCCSGFGPNTPDEVPWCSAFVNRMAWLQRLPRSKSAMARSWLTVGQAVEREKAVVGYDVVVLERGVGKQPDASVLDAPGHVGIYAGMETSHGPYMVMVLGGNQKNGVTVQAFPVGKVLGIRRIG